MFLRKAPNIQSPDVFNMGATEWEIAFPLDIRYHPWDLSGGPAVSYLHHIHLL